MTARETGRRVAIWSLVALWFAGMLALTVAGDPSGLLGFFGFPIVGAIILTSRPGNGVGRVLLAVGFAAFAIGLGSTLGTRLPAWAESVANALTAPFWLLLPLIALVYPTGRIETTLGRVLAVANLVAAPVFTVLFLLDPAPLYATGRTNPFGVTAVEPILNSSISNALQGALAIGVLVDLGMRWRRADQVGRLQFRWLVFALAILVTLIAAISLALAVVPGFAVGDWTIVLAALVLNLIPVAILIAVTRHGLYEIGRVISRTVSYAAVTIVVVAVYALVVTSASLLLPDQSTIAVALATLIAAALFLPVLRWVQRRIDRRFDRERYDAETVVEAFGERLRIGADPAATTPDLTHAVERALQPTRVGVWTRGATR